MNSSVTRNILQSPPMNGSVPRNILQCPALLNYIYETSAYPKEHEQLKQLRETTRHKYEKTMGYLMNVPVDEAQFISILLKIMNAKKTLEIGVFTGYSLLATALALPPGAKVTAIDVDREAYKIGLPFIQKAGVEDKIDFVLGDALYVLNGLINDKQEGSYDYVFVDADKAEYIKYHELLLKLVKKGGIIAYDNTLWYGTVAMSDENDDEIDENNDEIELVDSIRKKRKPLIQFNNFIANDSRIESAIVSIGDGLTLCRRI